MPTEGEWEWAARGGASSQGYTYSGSNDVNAVAWHFGNSGNSTQSAAIKAGNELGIYDMSGTVWELVQELLVCGGSWNFGAGDCTVIERGEIAAGDRSVHHGFRLARNLGPKIAINGTLPSATLDQPYAGFTFNSTGTNAPVAWSTNGTLPPGMTFNATTATLSGTPTTLGNYTFTLRLDSGGYWDEREVAFQTFAPLPPEVNVTTVMWPGAFTGVDGQGEEASFYSPFSVARDASGNLYVADTYNHRIRKITASGVVTTLAGGGGSGNYGEGYADGQGTSASFYWPTGVAVDGSGNVYVADSGNNRIRKITASGLVSTLAGSGNWAFADGQGTSAAFSYPNGVAVDGSGNVYVADNSNHRVRKITAAGVVTTLAGSGSQGSTNGNGTSASFNYPTGVTVDGSGNVYVADRNNNRIRKITADGVVTTLAGSGSGTFADGNGTSASFYYPSGVTVDGSGNVYVADNSNHRIRKITIGPKITVNGIPGLTTATPPDAGQNQPYSYTLGVVGTNSTLAWTLVSGTLPPGVSFNATSGTLSGTATTLGNYTYRIRLNSGGYSDEVEMQHQVLPPRIIGLSGNLSFGDASSIYPTTRTLSITNTGSGDLAVTGITCPSGFFGNWSGTIAPGATQNVTVTFAPTAVQSYSGNISVASDAHSGSNVIACTGGGIAPPVVTVTTLAGSGSQGSTNGNGTSASFYNPTGVTVDGSGNVYVADYNNHRIRKITADGVVTTLAGSGSGTFADGNGTSASFYNPVGVTVDGSGNVYVADYSNHRIRKITAAGVVTTLAGSGSATFADGNGTSASFNGPRGVTVDGSGNVYV
ncbi:MAG: putative Ig domain-containing protein, partial [Spartobacteria bacterium]